METISYGEVPPGAAGVPAQDAGHLLGGTYLLEREIGRGGMGEVYLATHARLPGRYAVKLLLPELAENREAFTRFCREAEIMSELRHPNIVQIFDFNIAPDERPYFVMEYLEGRDLEARLTSGPLPLAAVVRIVNAVASALAVAHAHGVVHRDLKPSNIFLATINGQTDEMVKVLDFGISKIRSAPQQIVSSTNMMGTPPYMAPEQVRGHVDAIDGRTDQFALGVICHRMLTGQEAFRGDDVASLLYQVVHENPPPISQFVPQTWDPAPLQAVLDRALAKEPERRWGGMMELARAFEEAAERTMCAPTRQRPAAAHAGGGGTAAEASALDAPPPVRPRPQLRLVTPPSGTVPALPPHLLVPQRAAAPQRSMRGAPALRSETPSFEWDLPVDVDRLPVTRLRAAVMGVFALVLVATLIATGWYRELPEAIAFVSDNFSALSRRPRPLHQPRAAQDPPPAAAQAPAAAKQPEPVMEGPQQQPAPAAPRAQDAEPPVAAKAAPPPKEPRKSARKASRRPAAKSDASATAPHRESPHVVPPVTPADLVNETVPTPAPSPAPATRSPGQPEGGFNIAPPTQFERGRDFAPPGDGTRDDMVEPSPPASMPTPPRPAQQPYTVDDAAPPDDAAAHDDDDDDAAAQADDAAAAQAGSVAATATVVVAAVIGAAARQRADALAVAVNSRPSCNFAVNP